MAARDAKDEAAHKALAVALILDHEADAAQDILLAALVGRLVESGIAHLTVVGAGDVRPETWRPAFKFCRSSALAPGILARHFRSSGISLSLLPNGSGRAVVAAATRAIVCRAEAKPSFDEIDAAIVDVAGSSPDLVIVTGGGSGLRGGLVWSAAYAELIFLNSTWTALSPDDLDNALKEFEGRARRFGGLVPAEKP